MTSRRRWLLFAAAAVTLGLIVTVTVLSATDVYLHGRYERSAGFNVWGYRGPSVGRKKTGEYRLFNDRWYQRGNKTENNCGLWIVRDGMGQEVHRDTRGTRLESGDEIHLGLAVVKVTIVPAADDGEDDRTVVFVAGNVPAPSVVPPRPAPPVKDEMVPPPPPKTLMSLAPFLRKRFTTAAKNSTWPPL